MVDSWIDVYPLRPPMGEKTHAAKAIIKGAGDKAPLMHEFYGTSPQEAREKALAELNEWRASVGLPPQ